MQSIFSSNSPHGAMNEKASKSWGFRNQFLKFELPLKILEAKLYSCDLSFSSRYEFPTKACSPKQLCGSDKKDSKNRFLHREDSVEGDIAPFAEVPCFLPVVPRMTSCNPDLFQHMEYPHVKVVRAVSECWNSLGGIGATKTSGLFTWNGSINLLDRGKTRSCIALIISSPVMEVLEAIWDCPMLTEEI